MTATIERARLPNRRKSIVFKLRLSEHKVFIAVGVWPDGHPAEVWIDTAKDGTTLRGMMADFARSVSIALQYGAPLRALAHSFRGIEYPPNGPVEGHETIKSATSIGDLVFQVLEQLETERATAPLAVPVAAADERIGFRPPRLTRDQAQCAGYSGDPCPDCGQFMLVRNGTCLKCDSCGGTTGCS